MKLNAKEIRKINDKDRMWFAKKWAQYVRTHPDKVWSKQQNILINSMIQNAKDLKLTPKQFLKIKEESR